MHGIVCNFYTTCVQYLQMMQQKSKNSLTININIYALLRKYNEHKQSKSNVFLYIELMSVSQLCWISVVVCATKHDSPRELLTSNVTGATSHDSCRSIAPSTVAAMVAKHTCTVAAAPEPPPPPVV